MIMYQKDEAWKYIFILHRCVRQEKADTKNNYIMIVHKLQTDDFVMDTYHSYIQACPSF